MSQVESESKRFQVRDQVLAALIRVMAQKLNASPSIKILTFWIGGDKWETINLGLKQVLERAVNCIWKWYSGRHTRCMNTAPDSKNSH